MMTLREALEYAETDRQRDAAATAEYGRERAERRRLRASLLAKIDTHSSTPTWRPRQPVSSSGGVEYKDRLAGIHVSRIFDDVYEASRGYQTARGSSIDSAVRALLEIE